MGLNLCPWDGWIVGFKAIGESFALVGGEVGGFIRADIHATALGAVRAEEDFRCGGALHVDDA